MADLQTHVRLSSRTPAGAGHAASGARPASPAMLYVAIGMPALIAAGVALATEDPALRLVLAAVAVMMAMFLGYLRTLVSATAPQRVRARADGPLTFIPPAALDRWPFPIAGTGLLPGVIAATFDPTILSGQGAVWIWAITGLSIGWLAQQAMALRIPRGLEVSESGLVGVRGATRLRLTWDQVGEVTTRPAGRDGELVIDSTEGGTFINASRLGSDPAVVAAVIAHYRDHPQDRQMLAAPLPALRHVEQTHAS